ncbi:hypothetical protein B0H14DRAFT_2533425 [Mycena olivaceomarginata]|nr:hypothetical protein B0H14DRAFT_2533425 [Mycena olivaceomarginata]
MYQWRERGAPPTSLPPSLPSIHPPPDSGSVHTSAIGNSSTVDITSTTAPSIHPPPDSGSVHTSAIGNFSTVDITSTTAPSLDISGPSDDDADVRIRTLKLAAGKYITFSEADVPDPPATSYARHIEDLLSDWDDNLPRWKGNSPLKINGVPIALIYWPTVFKYWKGTQWKGVKKTWFEWKILFHAMSATTLDNFWDRYSVPDKAGQPQRMKYTPLLKELAKERQAENERLADLARRELTAEQLTYRKGGGHFVMTKPAMIAAHYRKLKGLVDVEDMDTNDDDT